LSILRHASRRDCSRLRSFSASLVALRARAASLLPPVMDLSGRVSLSTAANRTSSFSLSLIATRPHTRLFAPSSKFLKPHGIHRFRTPMEDGGNVRHRIVHVRWEFYSAASLGSKKPATLAPSLTRS